LSFIPLWLFSAYHFFHHHLLLLLHLILLIHGVGSIFHRNSFFFAGSEVLTTVTVKNVFWDVAPCGFIINWRFGETCRLHPMPSNIRQGGVGI
jgi:hypothetical protein